MPTYFPENGEVRNLRNEDVQGKWAVIVFYPADYTFVCPTELADFAENHKAFKDVNAEVVAVSTDTVFTHKAWLEEEKLLENVKYPLVADHTGRLTRDFGVYNEETGMAQRGVFVVDPDGVIKASVVTDEPVGRSAKEILRLVKALNFVRNNPGAACPANWDDGAATLTPSIEIAGKVHEQLNVQK